MSVIEPVVISIVLLITFAGATHVAVGLLGRAVPFPAIQSALSLPHQRTGTLRLIGLIAATGVGLLSQAVIVGGFLAAPAGGIVWVSYAVELLLAVGWTIVLGRVAARRPLI